MRLSQFMKTDVIECHAHVYGLMKGSSQRNVAKLLDHG